MVKYDVLPTSKINRRRSLLGLTACLGSFHSIDQESSQGVGAAWGCSRPDDGPGEENERGSYASCILGFGRNEKETTVAKAGKKICSQGMPHREPWAPVSTRVPPVEQKMEGISVETSTLCLRPLSSLRSIKASA